MNDELRESLYEYGLAVARKNISGVRIAAILFLAFVSVPGFYGYGSWSWQVLYLGWLFLGASFMITPPFEHRFAERWSRRMAEADRDQPAPDNPAYANDFRTPRVPPRSPDREAYLALTLFAILTFGLWQVLFSVEVAGLGPADAPAIAALAVSGPTLIALGIAAVPRLLRAWGAKAKDTGQGNGAASTGEAAVIRAEKEGEAAVLRAQAELKRAEAEYLRAEKGLDPLPAPQLPPPDQPPALPPGSGNGASPTGTPQLPSA